MFNPFPHTKKYAADDFENTHAKTWKIYINENIITEKN